MVNPMGLGGRAKLTAHGRRGKMITVNWLQVFAVAFAAFAVGFALCNVIRASLLSRYMREDSDNKAPKTNRNRDDR